MAISCGSWGQVAIMSKKKDRKMSVIYIMLKIIMWVMIIFFLGDLVIQTISYSFYKGDRTMKEVKFTAEKIEFNDALTGYGYGLDLNSDKIILCFGGSMYIAYNTVGTYGGYYNCPFISVDYYGTQDSQGKMNLKTMKQSAEELYDWTAEQYPEKDIIVIGHSYGCGIAAYLASVRNCRQLILLSGFRTSADMYNKILPIYWGPLQVFIKNNIRIDRYAINTSCLVTIIGSYADTILSVELQEKVAACYSSATLKIFEGIKHEDYLRNAEVIAYIKEIIQ